MMMTASAAGLSSSAAAPASFRLAFGFVALAIYTAVLFFRKSSKFPQFFIYQWPLAPRSGISGPNFHLVRKAPAIASKMSAFVTSRSQCLNLN